jgi:hypothetical protein
MYLYSIQDGDHYHSYIGLPEPTMLQDSDIAMTANHSSSQIQLPQPLTFLELPRTPYNHPPQTQTSKHSIHPTPTRHKQQHNHQQRGPTTTSSPHPTPTNHHLTQYLAPNIHHQFDFPIHRPVNLATIRSTTRTNSPYQTNYRIRKGKHWHRTLYEGTGNERD